MNRAGAELAETIAVLPTVAVKVETYLGDLEGVMGTIEDACSANMAEVREIDEWKNAEAAAEQARSFGDQ